jgi:putative ABC transport system permease protein
MSLFQDLRFALRITRKNPGFTAVAVAALALGIGANSTVFTVVNTILFKSLPFKDGHEIVSLSCIRTDKGGARSAVSYSDFQDWRSRAASLQGIAAFSTGTMNVTDPNGVPERYSGAWLTANAFGVIGQSPVIGRDFLPQEDQPGAQPVVLIGYGMWQNRYGGRPDILGKTIRVNAVSATVIGIMPQGMKFPFDADLWMPLLKTKDREARNYRDLAVFGRLSKGVPTAQASSERQGIRQMLAGLTLGVIGAVAADRVMEKLLLHTSAADPAVNLAGALLLCVVALSACMIPAWRASRLDPLLALRFKR